MTNDEIIEAVDAYSDIIKRLCFTYMKSKNEAEDVYQEVFLKLVKCNKTFDSDEHKKAWIIRVTVNLCKDNLRSFFRKNVSSLDKITEEYYETNDYSWIREAVMGLPEKYRIVIYLFYYEGYSAMEIAEMLECKENTVFTRLNRARNILKEKIGDD